MNLLSASSHNSSHFTYFRPQVKIGLIQNKIVLPTDAPIQDQVKIIESFYLKKYYFLQRYLAFSGGLVL